MPESDQPQPLRPFRSRRPRRWLAGAALLAAGAGGGGILASNLTAGAATTTSPASTAATAPAQAPPDGHGGPMGLPLSGTVTAVGPASVTVKTATAATTYAVTSTSDIDKNGEATLASLAKGDAVTFNTVSGAAAPTIDKLHAGNEALDRPTGPPGPPPGAPSGALPGTAGGGA
ncbi:MAG: hypothetical protein ACRDXE_08560 [Acidimicrobiales bacterium]